MKENNNQMMLETSLFKSIIGTFIGLNIFMTFICLIPLIANRISIGEFINNSSFLLFILNPLLIIFTIIQIITNYVKVEVINNKINFCTTLKHHKIYNVTDLECVYATLNIVYYTFKFSNSVYQHLLPGCSRTEFKQFISKIADYKRKILGDENQKIIFYRTMSKKYYDVL